MKRFAIWTGLIAASWGMVIGLAMCASQALAQGVAGVPDSVTSKALEGFDDGGFKAVAVVALAGVVALGALSFWLIKALVSHLKAGADVALEQAKADVRTSDRLAAIENVLRARGGTI
jgi:hypothetical protein